jgi:hypothetical protein
MPRRRDGPASSGYPMTLQAHRSKIVVRRNRGPLAGTARRKRRSEEARCRVGSSTHCAQRNNLVPSSRGAPARFKVFLAAAVRYPASTKAMTVRDGNDRPPEVDIRPPVTAASHAEAGYRRTPTYRHQHLRPAG